MLKRRNRDRDTGDQPGRQLSAAEAAKHYQAEAPEVAFLRARDKFHESVGAPTVAAARAFVINVMQSLCIIGLTIYIIIMHQRSEVQPWVVKVDSSRGTATVETDLAKRWAEYKPDRAVLEREFTTVLRDMYLLNAAAVPVIQEGYKRSFAYMRGTAAEQFREFIRKEDAYQRMRTIPGLVRSFEVSTVTFRNDAQVVLIRFSTEERVAGSTAPIRKNLIAQFTYVRVSDMTQDEMRANPLGLYVVNFDIQEER